MNKKGDTRGLNIMVVCVLLFVLFFGFMNFYTSSHEDLKREIKGSVEGLKHSSILLATLKQNNIADLLAVGKFNAASNNMEAIFTTYYSNLNYIVYLDEGEGYKEIFDSDNRPENPVTQELFVPAKNKKVIRIKLELE